MDFHLAVVEARYDLEQVAVLNSHVWLSGVHFLNQRCVVEVVLPVSVYFFLIFDKLSLK
jgi:hypothetical protein